MVGKLKELFMSDWKQNLALLLILSIIFFISLWQLPYSPATWFDEGISLGIAKSFATKGIFNLEVAPGEFVSQRNFLITNNYPVLLPVASSIKLFGSNLFSARLPMADFILVFSLAAYFLVKKVYSKEAAIWSLALIASFAPFYGNGKAVLGEVPGLVYFLIGLLLLADAVNTKRLFLAGLFWGLSFATKPFFILILPAIFFGQWFSDGIQNKVFWKKLGLIGIGMFIPLSIIPLTVLNNFSFTEILNTVNYYSNSYAVSDFGGLVLQNSLRFFKETTPVHFGLMMAVSVLGIFHTFWKKRINQIEVILGTFILLNLLWYLKTPGWYRYFFPGHILLFLLFPAALKNLVSKKTFILIMGLLVLVQSWHLVSKRNDSVYYSDEAVRFADYLMRNTEENDSIMIMNSPSTAFLLENRQIYQYLQINPELHFTGSRTAEEVNPYYIVINEPKENILIAGLPEYLNSKFQLLNTIGHLNLYQRIYE